MTSAPSTSGWGSARPLALAWAAGGPERHGGPAGAGRHHSPAAVARGPLIRCASARRPTTGYACAGGAAEPLPAWLEAGGRRQGAVADLRAHAAFGGGLAAGLLRPAGVAAIAYHAGMDPEEPNAGPGRHFRAPPPVLVPRSPRMGVRPLRCGLVLSPGPAGQAPRAYLQEFGPGGNAMAAASALVPVSDPPIAKRSLGLGDAGLECGKLTDDVQEQERPPPGAAQQQLRRHGAVGRKGQPCREQTSCLLAVGELRVPPAVAVTTATPAAVPPELSLRGGPGAFLAPGAAKRLLICARLWPMPLAKGGIRKKDRWGWLARRWSRKRKLISESVTAANAPVLRSAGRR